MGDYFSMMRPIFRNRHISGHLHFKHLYIADFDILLMSFEIEVVDTLAMLSIYRRGHFLSSPASWRTAARLAVIHVAAIAAAASYSPPPASSFPLPQALILLLLSCALPDAVSPFATSAFYITLLLMLHCSS